MARAHRGDHQEAGDAEFLRGLDALQRAAEVDGALSLGPAPGARARGVDDRVRAADMRADVVGLEVAEHRVGPVGFQIGRVGRVADQPASGVSTLREQSHEATGDLSVASGDEDVHSARLLADSSGAGRWRFGADALWRRAARTGRVSDLVSVLDVDPALAELVPREQRAQARQATATSTVTFEAGAWQAPISSEAVRGGYGLLVISGLLLRRAGIEGRHAAELLGPGDLLRPWQHEDGGETTLEVEWTWRVVATARCAVLDPRWTTMAATWPQIGAELAGARSDARCGS